MSRPRRAFPQAHRPVLVEWIDSVHSTGWSPVREPSDMRCVSAGFLVAKTADRVTLAINRDGDRFGHFMEIPRVAVTRIRTLR